MRNLPAVILAVLALALFAAVPSLARNGSDDSGGDDNGGADNATRVTRSGDCSGHSNWKLRVRPDDGRHEVEFEVDQNRNGVRWTVRLYRNGRRVVIGHATTHAPSGSFSFERRLRNPAGTDRITARATRRGESCRGSARI